MQITLEKSGIYIIIRANGRLDASWSEYFLESCFEQVRNGQHHMIIDAEKLAFLSSAGIRSLVRIYKELNKVNGSFLIVRAQQFVAKTIGMTGFKHWLSEDWPEGTQQNDIQQEAVDSPSAEVYTLDQSASIEMEVIADWVPWTSMEAFKVRRLAFPKSVFALGIGGAAQDDHATEPAYGEFIAVGGHVVFQPAEEKSRPDYLFAEKEYIPEMEVLQAVYCKGEMAGLFRFSPHGEKLSFPLSELAEQALSMTETEAAALVILGETDGLVGAVLTKPPVAGTEIPPANYPDMREWLSFSGDRIYAGEQTLIFGVVSKVQKDYRILRPLPSKPGLNGHFHATVITYQPLENGKIDLHQQVSKLLNGPPPKALIHLIDDNRPAAGLGQSSLVRGACWCSPIKNVEDLL